MAGSNRGRVKRSGNQRLFGLKPLPVTMPRTVLYAAADDLDARRGYVANLRQARWRSERICDEQCEREHQWRDHIRAQQRE